MIKHDHRFQHDNIIVNTIDGRVFIDNMAVRLSMQEYQILMQFMSHQGITLSVKYLSRAVLGEGYSKNTVWTIINRLRKKIERGQYKHIVTVEGGYVMPEEVLR